MGPSALLAAGLTLGATALAGVGALLKAADKASEGQAEWLGLNHVQGMRGLGLVHLVVALLLMCNLTAGPRQPLGVPVTETEQVWMGVWTIAGLVLLPNAYGATQFDIPGVVEFYGAYLVLTLCGWLAFLLRVLLLGSFCRAVLPVAVLKGSVLPSGWGEVFMCACFDSVVTFGALLVLVAFCGVCAWVLHVARRLRHVDPPLVMPPPYGSFGKTQRGPASTAHHAMAECVRAAGGAAPTHMLDLNSGGNAAASPAGVNAAAPGPAPTSPLGSAPVNPFEHRSAPAGAFGPGPGAALHSSAPGGYPQAPNPFKVQ